MNDDTRNPAAGFHCPLPVRRYPTVQLAHGGGGRLTQQLVEEMFLPAFVDAELDSRHDGAVLEIPRGRLAFTTDSYVVRPLFFPGGDIGMLAIHGSVNDLAMCGARPLYLSVGFILEEGLSMDTLWRVVQSMKAAAAEAGVRLVTGDTKVVDRGKGDGIFINTAGIGVIEHDRIIAPRSVRPGDAIIVSGDIGRHGIAVMAVREGLEFECLVESDCADVSGLALSILGQGIDVHCLRDLTRGGLASALVEIAETAGLEIRVEEAAIPVREDVRGACEMLGFDPLYVANEGRFICFVPPAEAEKTVALMRTHPLGRGAALIGKAAEGRAGMVSMKSLIGAYRIVDMLSGEQLPRIC